MIIPARECDALLCQSNLKNGTKLKRNGAWVVACNHPENEYIYFKCTVKEEANQTEFEVAILRVTLPQSAIEQIANSRVFSRLGTLSFVLMLLATFYPIPTWIEAISVWFSVVFVTVVLIEHLIIIRRNRE